MNSVIRKAMIFALVMLVVAFAGWFGRKAYKKSEEHKLLAMARQYEAQKDWHNTNLCLERVLQIDPISVDASKMIGDLLEEAGSPAALTWRIRAAELEPNNVTNLFLWAKAAIQARNLKSAGEALSKIDDRYTNTADYYKLKGVLAWNEGQSTEAEGQYGRALQLEPNNQSDILNLETIHLESTNQAVANAARLALEQKITDKNLRRVALKHLLTYATGHKELPQALAYSREIIESPSASFQDKIIHLQLLRAARDANYGPWLTSLKTAAAQSPMDALALGHSLALIESPAVALGWLNKLPHQMQTNFPVPLVITDCQISLKDWSGLLAFVGDQDWGAADFYRLAVESLAQRSLGREDAANLDWHRAVRLSAHQENRLERLASLAKAWDWIPEENGILSQVTDEFPEQKWAVDELMSRYYSEGNTGELQALLVKSLSANPDDIHIKNNLANVLLLRKSEMDQANAMAKEVYDSAPDNPFFISTYAYSLLLQNKPDEALKVLNNLKPEYLKIPSVAAYYAVIEAGAGHKDVARQYIAQAEGAKLLPEEKEMVRLAKAQL